jgi:hypothetical protein
MSLFLRLTLKAQKSYTSYYLSLKIADTDRYLYTPREALMRTIQVYQDLAVYLEDLQNYLAPIERVIENYPGIVASVKTHTP